MEAAIGKVTIVEDYIRSKVNSWFQQLKIVSQITEFQPADINGFKHILTFLCTITSNLEQYMQSIEEVIQLAFIPAITSKYIRSDNERKLLAIPIKFGGLGLLDYRYSQNIEYRNSREVTQDLFEI